MVMDQQGSEVVLEKLGANATGLPFNSGLAIELRPDRPQNPLVNAGAISAVSLIKAKTLTTAGSRLWRTWKLTQIPN